MSSWTDDVDDGDDSEQESEEDEQSFPDQFESAVEDGKADDLGELDYVNHIGEIDNEDTLREAASQLDGEKQTIVENRLNSITEDSDEEDETEEESEEESEDSGWGGTPVDEVDEEEESEEAEESPEPSIESVDEMEDDEPDLGGETAETESSEISGDSSGMPKPSSAMSVKEAAAKERRWKVLVWGPPGLFKSHFCYTAPEPVAFLDLEGKAQDIAHKFDDREIQIWQPQGFREAQDALQEAIEWLDWWHEEKDETGTIVVDSISLAWEWAKTAYKTEAYPMKDNDEVTLSSNMGSSQESDWQHIKGMHNSEFRQWMTDSRYNFIWTAMETEDYAAVMDGSSNGGTPMKPEGEKNNVHKADTILRARKNDSGLKVGDLTKSNFTDNLFMELERPTFPKVRDTIEAIEEAETSPSQVDRSKLESDLDVKIVRGDPEQYNE